MKHAWLVLIILIMGCQSSSELSFQSLNQAFISWYYKLHPIEATRFGIEKYNEKVRIIGNSENDEYVADVSRFIIELSQIDATKLSQANRIDYHILYANLEKTRYVMNNIRPWEWNPLTILDEIYDGLFLLSERPGINMGVRVKAVQGRLKYIPELLNRSKEMMIEHSPLHIKQGYRRIDSIIRLMDQLPLKLNSDNLTLDEIDESIELCKEALLSYHKWMDQHASHMPLFQFPLTLKLSDKAFPYFIGKKYVPENVYKLADKKLSSIHNRIFSLAFPIYLKYNDEPVWLDWDDTLEVIHWTIDNIRNKPEYQVSNASILSHFYESISNLEQLSSSKGFIPRNVRKRIKLDIAPNYIRSGSPISLFNYHPKESNSEILYYIKGDEDNGSLFPLISHEIDLVNSRYIIPGRSIQIAHAQKYPSMIRYMFPDPITSSGWEVYAMQMLMNKEFVNWNNEYHILRLKVEIMAICQAIIEGKYYSGEIDRKEALSYLIHQAFLNDNEAEEVMLESDLQYFSGTEVFIGMMEMNSLLTEYKREKGDKFNILNFHKLILKDGIIPLYALKKQILSH